MTEEAGGQAMLWIMNGGCGYPLPAKLLGEEKGKKLEEGDVVRVVVA